MFYHPKFIKKGVPKNFKLVKAASDITMTPYFNVVISVDAFLVIGGTLRAYNMVKQLEKNDFNCFTDFMKRYLRWACKNYAPSEGTQVL